MLTRMKMTKTKSIATSIKVMDYLCNRYVTSACSIGSGWISGGGGHGIVAARRHC